MQERIEKLERWNRFLLLGICIIIGVGAAAPINDTIRAREIILTHPDGNSQLVLRATQDQCLFQMSGVNSKENTVSIYRDDEGAVIGTYSQSNNAAIATSSKGSILQLAGQEKKVVLSPQNWNPQVQGNPNYEVKFR